MQNAGDTSSPLSFSSLAVCADAALSASKILELYVKRGHSIMPVTLGIAFYSALVLLISVWSVKKSGLELDTSEQVAAVQICINTLHVAETRYVEERSAGSRVTMFVDQVASSWEGLVCAPELA